LGDATTRALTDFRGLLQDIEDGFQRQKTVAANSGKQAKQAEVTAQAAMTVCITASEF
jgi:hypothetical protein